MYLLTFFFFSPANKEIVNARVFFHAPGDPPLEARLSALVRMFDADSDGKLTQLEVKTVISKVLCVLRRIVYFALDVGMMAVYDGALEPSLRKLWVEIFPEGAATPSMLQDVFAQSSGSVLFEPLKASFRGAVLAAPGGPPTPPAWRQAGDPFSIEAAVEQMRDKPVLTPVHDDTAVEQSATSSADEEARVSDADL